MGFSPSEQTLFPHDACPWSHALGWELLILPEIPHTIAAVENSLRGTMEDFRLYRLKFFSCPITTMPPPLGVTSEGQVPFHLKSPTQALLAMGLDGVNIFLSVPLPEPNGFPLVMGL
ncbi:hypothetical protein KIL84_004618 [Mauremys mutica]|uniref:Uncharacterized protein n=1 Tax=Mauremys mutica TaxID=74926 RepID=A0A9D3XPC3_9SAUR|nr:hypothetical protein KIL84_004618 [Mauremys mutica]